MSIRSSWLVKVFCLLDFLPATCSSNYSERDFEISDNNCEFLYFCLKLCYFLLHVF